MYTTSDTFATQLSTLAGDFKSVCGASCLFFWGQGASCGLRIECSGLAKEFVDKVDFGHDPEGFLFYDYSTDFDFDADESVTYKVYQNTESPPAIRVDFFPPGGDTSTRFSSFITKDTNGISSTLLASYEDSGSGKWQDLQIATTFGKLHKINSQTLTTLKFYPIGKELSFDIPKDDSYIVWSSDNHSLDITGSFSYKKTADLSAGTKAVADFNEDRIVFYRSSDKYLIGVFFPSKAIPVDDHADPNMPIATVSDL